MSKPASRTGATPLIAVYDSHGPVESMVGKLSRAGFDLQAVSIVGKRYRVEERPLGFYSTGDRIMGWDDTAGFWGSIWSQLAGPAVAAIPGIGLVAAAGPFGLALIAAGHRPVPAGSTSALAAALMSQGIGAMQAALYENDVRAHRFLVLVDHAAMEPGIAPTRAAHAAADHGSQPAWRPLP